VRSGPRAKLGLAWMPRAYFFDSLAPDPAQVRISPLTLPPPGNSGNERQR
jgi:hypothetical protein